MAMKTYSFRVVVEPDEDAQGNRAWHAYCPALERQGAATSGRTEAEAIRNINEVVQLVVGSMMEHGEFLPDKSTDDVEVTVDDPRISVTV
jgi:predicted RNase H-like HicB family nuclease